MRNILVPLFALITLLTSASAQDTVKKSVVKKPGVVKTSTTVVMPAGTKAATIDPKTGKPLPPINPKTGKPYTKYGYGAYANNKYDAKAAHTADSLKKAAALKTAATPPVVQQPVADSVTPAPVDKSLNGQYKYLLSKVYNYQQPLVSAFWKNIIDSLNTNKHKLLDAQTKAATQDKTISDLKADATAKDESVLKADEISFVGMSMSKSAYNLIMWGLVIALGAVAAIVIARSGSLKHEAGYRTGLYTELEEEYKNYKAKANEKEKKLARELQTERNKVDELMGRG
jgi:hypothetical protein